MAELLVEQSWSRKKMVCSAWPLHVCTVHPSKSHRVEEAAHQTGLLFRKGRTFLENFRSGDVFIVCLENSQMMTEMQKAYSISV